MRRRHFVTLAAGTAAWPSVALPQGPYVRPRVSILLGTAETPDRQSWIQALQKGLREAGRQDGRNLDLDTRWGSADPARIKAAIDDVLASRPAVIVARSARVLNQLHHAARDIPIVFITASDPVSHGFVRSLAQPGGNITGFVIYEASVAGKLVELLKEAAPRITRAGLLFDPENVSAAGYWREIGAVAASLSMRSVQLPIRDAATIEAALAEFAREPDGGLLLPTDATTTAHSKLIIALAARHRLPAAYTYRDDVQDGGLISYGPEPDDLFRKAGTYVGRILNGERPGDLPVQSPTQFEMAINLRTAAALELALPPSLLARADEVIE
jgi:putative ABC transport system substrate-binding protein